MTPVDKVKGTPKKKDAKKKVAATPASTTSSTSSTSVKKKGLKFGSPIEGKLKVLKQRKLDLDSPKEKIDYRQAHVLVKVIKPDAKGPGAQTAIVLQMKGAFENKYKSVMYTKDSAPQNERKLKLKLLKKLKCVDWMVDLRDPEGDDDTVVLTYKGKDGLLYAYKCLAWNTSNNPRDTLNKEDIKEWLEQDILPKMMKLLETSGWPQPKLADDWYSEHKSFSTVLDRKSIFLYIQKGIIDYSEEADTIGLFLKRDKEHLYSFWEPGKVPIDVMTTYGFSENTLDMPDWLRLQKWRQEQKADELSSDDSDDDDDDDSASKPPANKRQRTNK